MGRICRGRGLPLPNRVTARVTPDEYRVIKPLIQKKGFVKNADIQQALGMSRLQASRLAQRFVNLGLLEMVGEKKGARYIKAK